MRIFSILLLLCMLTACTSPGNRPVPETQDTSLAPAGEKVGSDRDGVQTTPDTLGGIPPNGTYTYDMAFAEWQGKSLDEKVEITIRGDSIRVVYAGKGALSAAPGEVLDEGLIRKHRASGKWIIAHKEEDVHAEAAGGCSGGPNVIDFANRRFRTC